MLSFKLQLRPSQQLLSALSSKLQLRPSQQLLSVLSSKLQLRPSQQLLSKLQFKLTKKQITDNNFEIPGKPNNPAPLFANSSSSSDLNTVNVAVNRKGGVGGDKFLEQLEFKLDQPKK